jgi:hypothetical protein
MNVSTSNIIDCCIAIHGELGICRLLGIWVVHGHISTSVDEVCETFENRTIEYWLNDDISDKSKLIARQYLTGLDIGTDTGRSRRIDPLNTGSM